MVVVKQCIVIDGTWELYGVFKYYVRKIFQILDPPPHGQHCQHKP